MLYTSFLDMTRRHHLPSQLLMSTYSLGTLLAREADAMQMLGR
jgi:hypothetical protein